jgi:hypothetical protein
MRAKSMRNQGGARSGANTPQARHCQGAPRACHLRRPYTRAIPAQETAQAFFYAALPPMARRLGNRRSRAALSRAACVPKNRVSRPICCLIWGRNRSQNQTLHQISDQPLKQAWNRI